MGSGLQLFSKRDRRSSLLLLGRSGGSRYERSSSGFVSSGRSWKRSTETQMRCRLRGSMRNAGNPHACWSVLYLPPRILAQTGETTVLAVPKYTQATVLVWGTPMLISSLSAGRPMAGQEVASRSVPLVP